MLRTSRLWRSIFPPAFMALFTVMVSPALAADEKSAGDSGTPGAGSEPVSNGEPQPKQVIADGDHLLASLNEFQIALRKCLVRESGKADALTVGVTVVPEAYRFQLMEAFLKLLREGHRGDELWRRLRRHHLELKPNMGKSLLRISIQGT